MTREDKDVRDDAINIVIDFNEWLEDMAKKYGWDKDEVQLLIKWSLM